MDHIKFPSKKVWEQRLHWFNAAEEESRGEGSYLVSEQACALVMDVQAAFCIGAWLAVQVLAVAVMDAALRETELPEFSGNTKRLFDVMQADLRMHELRKQRNRLLHVNTAEPAVTAEDQWINRESLEEAAKKAVEIMFQAIYYNPCV